MHILAVDDEPSIVELLEAFVNATGENTIETALCATDALDLVARSVAKPFDCFLLDIQMPGTDGIELCQILRDRPEYQETPILMLTAMSDKSYIDRAFAAGANDYITKPFEIGELRGRLASVENLVVSSKKLTVGSTTAPVKPDTEALSGVVDARPPLHEPFRIKNVDGVIGHHALENYVSLISKQGRFKSCILAFSIRGIRDLFEITSWFEFECLVTDVSEAIAACLEGHQFLTAYAGSGTFVCILEEGWVPDSVELTDKVNLLLSQMGLSFNDGRPMNVSVSAGDVIRLVWKSGDRAIDALAQAHESAERESQRYGRNLEDFWYNRSA
ncbi:Response regulator receiver domain-containing protein [Roseovarius marisflavi]|uniref:Response regulator receiver domain-containing protein n=1 Tax=Roseovarius marisflavi TaxID=1054996 RepID=A0A1M7DJJ5_9RHOB|nr:response regulator [Roseovarius marisflavi]SHL79694.1 Response regulator receiver domain-containing protein [Roseovarius marisflavi]